MKRRFIDAPTEDRCRATVRLGDGSEAQCGRRKTTGDLCTQHAKIAKRTSEQPARPAEAPKSLSRSRASSDDMPLPSNALALADELFQRLLDRADVKAALRAMEAAQIRRDSVSRKLCAGSAAVNAAALAQCEAKLADAKCEVVRLAIAHPALMNHPPVAVLSAQVEKELAASAA